MVREKIFINHILDKRLDMEYIKDSQNSKKQTVQFFSLVKELNRCFQLGKRTVAA